MYLDYSKLKSGQTKQPVLRLKTLAGKELGVIPWVYNLTFELNYSDVSSVEFDVPRHSNPSRKVMPTQTTQPSQPSQPMSKPSASISKPNNPRMTNPTLQKAFSGDVAMYV